MRGKAVACALLLALGTLPATGQLVCPADPPLRIEIGPYRTAGFALTSEQGDEWFANVRAVCEWGATFNAAAVPYTATVGADWGVDPDDVQEATDQLAERLTDEEAKADDDVPEVGDFGALALSGDVTSLGLVTTVGDDTHAHGAGTISGLDAGDTTTGTFADARISAASVTQHEAALEGVLDLADMQGAVTDGQVPNDITVDLATLATTATTANAGDSATAFFGAGTIEAARLPAVTTLASACTDAQVLGGTAAGTGVECQADATGTDSADDLSDNDLGDLGNVDETGCAEDEVLTRDGSGGWVCAAAVGGSGDVVGPASSTDNAVARFDSTTGKLLKNSGVLIDASNNLEIPASAELQLPLENVAATPTLNFGDGDTGIYEQGDDVLAFVANATARYIISGSTFTTSAGGGAAFNGASSSATTPSIVPRAGETTGLGWAATADGRLIANSSSRLSYSNVANSEGIGFLNGNFTADSDARARVLTARNITTTATPAELFLNGSSTRMVLANDSTWTFACTVTARRTDADGESAGYRLEGVIDRQTNAASTALVGSVTTTVLAEDTAAWDVTATADTTNGALVLTVTGEASKTIRWVGSCSTVETVG